MFRLVVLVAAVLVIENVKAECFKNSQSDKDEVCIPGHWDIAKLTSAKITATSTCGTPPEKYCRLKPINGCFKCNSSDSKDRHPVGYIVDKGTNYMETWWQSETWWKWHQNYPSESLQVNITLNFNKSFDMTGLLSFTFESPRPHKMVLEKSSDWGRNWKILQYYASNCEQRFNMNDNDPTVTRPDDLSAFCTEKYSANSPQRGGKLLFDFTTRYDEEEGFFKEDIQKYLHTTDLRIRLQYPGTNGMEKGKKTEDILNQFYYAISDLSIIGRCKCYGHAKFCDYPKPTNSVTQSKCVCKHNTAGNDCERCLPLYNNRTWMAATSKYDPNPCQKCECNQHADACVFNKDLGFGVCQDCKHNTTGYFCDQCKVKFYRNMSLLMSHPLACPACDCDARGITNNGSCHSTNGQCECRYNVTGRQCDRCVDTYYGYTVHPVGYCTACRCVEMGTKSGSLNCDQITGNCDCKKTIDQRTCSRCRHGYFGFPTTINGECERCQCDYGGSSSQLCNKTNGICECRENIQGVNCTVVLDGYYTGSLTHFKLEAEEAEGNYLYTANTQDLNKYFTGTGYGKITGKQFINFQFKSNVSFESYILLRYTSVLNSIDDIQVKIYGDGEAECPFESRTLHIRDLKKGSGNVWKSNSLLHVCKGQEYNFNVSFETKSIMNSSIELDSLILLPNIENTTIYKIAKNEGHANGIDVSKILDCWSNGTTLASARQSLPICKNVTFSVMAQFLDGALPCECNSTGSLPNTLCNKQGGQCKCKPGVTGRSCDRCMPGYYNYTSHGCTACNCSSLGSHSLVCDAVTGKCPCRSGVITRTCGRCNHTYYGFVTGRGCVECKCNASGSANLQCDDATGKCPCKNSTKGEKCDECNHGFFNYTSTGCQACNCDKAGSRTLQCHLQTGECTCKKNVLGFKCDQCKNSTYNRAISNPDGCTPCYCYGRSSTCSSARGFVKKSVYLYPGTQNEGYTLSSDGENPPTFSRIDKKLLSTFHANGTFSLRLPQNNFANSQLRSYGELLTINMEYTATDSIIANWSLEIEKLGEVTKTFQIKPRPSVDVTKYYVRLHESEANENISANELQTMLADINFMTIHAFFNSTGKVAISSVALDTAFNGSIGKYAGNVENCSCNHDKYTGLSCELCGEYYTRDTTNAPRRLVSRYFKECKLCECNNRSKQCDAEYGRCENCRLGTTGFSCQLCQSNVDNTTDCTRCLLGYYGLYQPENAGCRVCDCLLANTLYRNQTVCDTGLNQSTDTGQCKCRDDITGRRCDRCHENAYNNSEGLCLDCPLCYGLLQKFVHSLRKNIKILETSIDHVRNGRMADETFANKLKSSTESVRKLVLRAQNSTGVERQLNSELQSLNQTLDHMERVLLGNVTPGVTSVEGVVTKASQERNMTEDLIMMTHKVLNQAYSLLNSSISINVSKSADTEAYLDTLVPRFVALANDASTISAQQNQTGQEILKKILTGEELVRDADSISNKTVSDHNVNSQVIRTLKLETEAVKKLSVETNSSAYAVFANSSVVLSSAKEALKRVNALNPNNSVELQQILSTTSLLADNATKAVRNVEDLNQRYSTLISSVVNAVHDSKMLVATVTSMDERATAMLIEARRAEVEAQSAVKSAAQTHKDAKEMLQLLQNFAKKASESQLLAEKALNDSKEVNQTSRNAIAYSERINASIQTALRIADDGLVMVKKAQDLAMTENKNVSAIHSQALVLKGNADASKHTSELLSTKKNNTVDIGTQIKQPTESCKVNYTKSAENAEGKSKEAQDKSQQASDEINKARKSIDQIMSVIPNLQKVNATRLLELQNDIKKLREAFSKKDVERLNVALRIDKDKQQTFINEKRKQLLELRRQVEEMKQLRNSLSSMAYRGCT